MVGPQDVSPRGGSYRVLKRAENGAGNQKRKAPVSSTHSKQEGRKENHTLLLLCPAASSVGDGIGSSPLHQLAVGL